MSEEITSGVKVDETTKEITIDGFPATKFITVFNTVSYHILTVPALAFTYDFQQTNLLMDYVPGDTFEEAEKAAEKTMRKIPSYLPFMIAETEINEYLEEIRKEQQEKEDNSGIIDYIYSTGRGREYAALYKKWADLKDEVLGDFFTFNLYLDEDEEEEKGETHE